MITTKYYIENLIDGTVLKDDGSWELFSVEEDHESFMSYENAAQHIADVLGEGVYRIFSRITKVL